MIVISKRFKLTYLKVKKSSMPKVTESIVAKMVNTLLIKARRMAASLKGSLKEFFESLLPFLFLFSLSASLLLLAEAEDLLASTFERGVIFEGSCSSFSFPEGESGKRVGVKK